MALDELIYKIGFIVLLVAVVRRQALFAAFLLCVSFLWNEYTFIAHPTWAELEHRYIMLAVKDAIIFLSLFVRQKTPEILLAVIFAVSCAYHQWMLVEIQNRILTLKHFRTEFMTIITALQIATVIILLRRGGSNGGKRAKHSLFNLNYRFNHFFDYQTCKDSK